jgi:hypothetical protein
MKHVSIRMLVATLCSLLFVFSVLASEQFGTDFSHIGVTVYDSFAHDKVAIQTGYPLHKRSPYVGSTTPTASLTSTRKLCYLAEPLG